MSSEHLRSTVAQREKHELGSKTDVGLSPSSAFFYQLRGFGQLVHFSKPQIPHP